MSIRPSRTRLHARRATLALLAGALLPSVNGSPAQQTDSRSITEQVRGPAPAERPLQLLFLGDRGHHQPAKRAQEARPVLAARGIHMFYSDDLDSLSPENLAPYDALLLYANHDLLPPAGEAALLDFVRSGKGFVPLHCASYCFRNSEAFVELVGAQFKSHGTGTFSTEHLVPEHPILAGLEPFECWDETYVHTRHNPERTVLSVRREGYHVEPWTWVREEGLGRIFYTAWGHDARTWTHPGFHDLLERGIRWAAGDRWLANSGPEQDLAYVEAGSPIPNYVGNWQLGDDFRRMQAPLEPARSLQELVVEPGLLVSLFASEPMLHKPITMAFGPRGRLWISETLDYPNQLEADGAGRDRISILEDEDGDGSADRATVFAEGLSIPTSICFADGGVIVTSQPHTLFLRDLDGDDRADERRVLFTGWGKGDTHAGPSNLRHGPDGWIWGTVGYSGFNGEVGGLQHRFGSGIYRFRPDGSALEFLASTSNNTWGLGFSEEGFCFASTANGRPSQHVGIENRYYESVAGLAGGVLDGIEETSEFHPVTDKVRQVDWHGRYTAGAGHALYTARSFPRSYWNRMAFVCGPTGHLVGRYELEPNGSHFVSRDRWTLLASRDEWTAPIMAEVGPDGAVWVIDWYNYIVQHNPTPRGFETGPGNAYRTPLRDKVHGRIWRVTAEGHGLASIPQLDETRPESLVAALQHGVLGWRKHAQRLLTERGRQDVVPLLVKMVEAGAMDEAGLAPGAMHSLWTLDALGALSNPEPRVLGALQAALSHPARGVRRAALQVLPRDESGRNLLLAGELLTDPDPKVLLQALLTLAEMPPSAEAAARLVALAQEPSLEDDRWLPDALTIAAARSGAEFLQAVFAVTRAEDTPTNEPSTPPDVAPNGTFESPAAGGERPDSWQVRHYSGEAGHAWVEDGRSGRRALRIDSEAGADSSWFASVDVVPGRTHRLSAWIRTRAVEAGSGRGAQLNVHELQGSNMVRTEAITGTRDWTRVAVTFDPGPLESVTVNCLFGGWGRSTGTAWFDDLAVEVLEGPALPGALGRVLQRVTRDYAERAPADSVAATIAALAGTPDVLATTVLTALEEGWRGHPAPVFEEDARARLGELARELDGESRAALALLLASWGQVDVLGNALGGVTRELLEHATDLDGNSEERLAALRRLIMLDDRTEHIEALLFAIDLDTDPVLAADLIEEFAASEAPATGALILERFGALGPSAQRAAVRTLGRRDEWTRQMLGAIQAGELSGALIDPATWLTLEQHPTAALAELAREAHGEPSTAERRALVEDLIKRPASAGDAARGRALHEEHCAACHVVSGRGGLVGPALDGIGKNPREEVLASILDPNRAVEPNYLLWIARTFDGQLYSGRLLSESRTSIEILESSGESRILSREDIESVTPSALSLMPEGFEFLGEQGLADLLEFLTETH